MLQPDALQDSGAGTEGSRGDVSPLTKSHTFCVMIRNNKLYEKNFSFQI